MSVLSPIVGETTCPECEGEGLTPLGDGWEVCESCYGVGSVKAGPAHPASCAICSTPLKWSGRGGYFPCLQHPRARVVYYLQEPKTGYPAGWPICRCGEPAVSGKATCGQYTCNTEQARHRGALPPGRKT